ncbi:hypothetical protein [Brevibacterium antiquum]|nr:hypothetical protein [Brevibacterium antiquum]
MKKDGVATFFARDTGGRHIGSMTPLRDCHLGDPLGVLHIIGVTTPCG